MAAALASLCACSQGASPGAGTTGTSPASSSVELLASGSASASPAVRDERREQARAWLALAEQAIGSELRMPQAGYAVDIAFAYKAIDPAEHQAKLAQLERACEDAKVAIELAPQLARAYASTGDDVALRRTLERIEQTAARPLSIDARVWLGVLALLGEDPAKVQQVIDTDVGAVAGGEVAEMRSLLRGRVAAFAADRCKEKDARALVANEDAVERARMLEALLACKEVTSDEARYAKVRAEYERLLEPSPKGRLELVRVLRATGHESEANAVLAQVAADVEAGKVEARAALEALPASVRGPATAAIAKRFWADAQRSIPPADLAAQRCGNNCLYYASLVAKAGDEALAKTIRDASKNATTEGPNRSFLETNRVFMQVQLAIALGEGTFLLEQWDKLSPDPKLLLDAQVRVAIEGARRAMDPARPLDPAVAPRTRLK